MKVGDIFLKDNIHYIVEEVVNGEVKKSQTLEDYVIENAIVECDGEFRTIAEIIDLETKHILRENTVVNV